MRHVYPVESEGYSTGALCAMLSALCPLPSSRFRPRNSEMLHTLCPLRYATCLMPHTADTSIIQLNPAPDKGTE